MENIPTLGDAARKGKCTLAAPLAIHAGRQRIHAGRNCLDAAPFSIDAGPNSTDAGRNFIVAEEDSTVPPPSSIVPGEFSVVAAPSGSRRRGKNFKRQAPSSRKLPSAKHQKAFPMVVARLTKMEKLAGGRPQSVGGIRDEENAPTDSEQPQMESSLGGHPESAGGTQEEKSVRATDAKEVGVENPAEETFCDPNN